MEQINANSDSFVHSSDQGSDMAQATQLLIEHCKIMEAKQRELMTQMQEDFASHQEFWNATLGHPLESNSYQETTQLPNIQIPLSENADHCKSNNLLQIASSPIRRVSSFYIQPIPPFKPKQIIPPVQPEQHTVDCPVLPCSSSVANLNTSSHAEIEGRYNTQILSTHPLENGEYCHENKAEKYQIPHISLTHVFTDEYMNSPYNFQDRAHQWQRHQSLNAAFTNYEGFKTRLREDSNKEIINSNDLIDANQSSSPHSLHESEASHTDSSLYQASDEFSPSLSLTDLFETRLTLNGMDSYADITFNRHSKSNNSRTTEQKISTNV
jgi:hypothetical protein